MRAAAGAYRLDSVVSLQEIAGGKHSLKSLMTESQLGGRVFEALFGLPLTQAASGDNGKESIRAEASGS
jgi:hypothetical protein